MLKTLLPALALATQLHAGEITTLPQGSSIAFQPEYLTTLHFFDEAWSSGWISLYGEMNGGTRFDTDFYSLAPTTIANLWWNLYGSGFALRYIVINDGDPDCKLYRVEDIANGNTFVSPFDNGDIRSIALFGEATSEADMSVTLFILALVFLLYYDQKAIS